MKFPIAAENLPLYDAGIHEDLKKCYLKGAETLYVYFFHPETNELAMAKMTVNLEPGKRRGNGTSMRSHHTNILYPNLDENMIADQDLANTRLLNKNGKPCGKSYAAQKGKDTTRIRLTRARILCRRELESRGVKLKLVAKQHDPESPPAAAGTAPSVPNSAPPVKVNETAEQNAESVKHLIQHADRVDEKMKEHGDQLHTLTENTQTLSETTGDVGNSLQQFIDHSGQEIVHITLSDKVEQKREPVPALPPPVSASAQESEASEDEEDDAEDFTNDMSFTDQHSDSEKSQASEDEEKDADDFTNDTSFADQHSEESQASEDEEEEVEDLINDVPSIEGGARTFDEDEVLQDQARMMDDDGNSRRYRKRPRQSVPFDEESQDDDCIPPRKLLRSSGSASSASDQQLIVKNLTEKVAELRAGNDSLSQASEDEEEEVEDLINDVPSIEGGARPFDEDEVLQDQARNFGFTLNADQQAACHTLGLDPKSFSSLQSDAIKSLIGEKMGLQAANDRLVSEGREKVEMLQATIHRQSVKVFELEDDKDRLIGDKLRSFYAHLDKDQKIDDLENQVQSLKIELEVALATRDMKIARLCQLLGTSAANGEVDIDEEEVGSVDDDFEFENSVHEGENPDLDAANEESSGVYSEEEAGSINDDFEFLDSESSVHEEGNSDSYAADEESSYASSEDDIPAVGWKPVTWNGQHEHSSVAEEEKDDSSYFSHPSDESSTEERCNDQAHDGHVAFRSADEESSYASSEDDISAIAVVPIMKPLPATLYGQHEYSSAAEEEKDDSSYCSHPSDESCNEESCNDQAHDGLVASTSSRDISSSIYPLTQSRGSLTATSFEGNIPPPLKYVLERILSEVHELKARLDTIDSDDDSDDDQEVLTSLNQFEDQLREEASRRDDIERFVDRLVNIADGLRIDMDNAQLIINALLDRPCGENTLASMRRKRRLIDALEGRRIAEFTNEQLERANAMDFAAALEERNRNLYQSSEEDSDED